MGFLDPLNGGKLEFTRRWFRNRNSHAFRTHVRPEWEGKPCTYLELGVYEGMSACWMLQHVLTHEASRLVCVDPWLMTTKRSTEEMEDVQRRAVHNLSTMAQGRPVGPEVFRAHSAEFLRWCCGGGRSSYRPPLGKGSVDVCMIDGNHWAAYVYDDAVHCFELLKRGGWLLFDDVRNDIPKDGHVAEGLQQFLVNYGEQVEPLFEAKYMNGYRKK